MPKLTLNKVKALIKSRRAVRWEAGETSVSYLAMLSKPGMVHMGIGVSEEELAAVQDSMMMTVARAKSPPVRIDWRNHKGANYVTSVRNQLTCGSCVAFATCATLEARDAVKRKAPVPTLNLSEAHLFYCGCGNCCGTGWQPDGALNFAQTTGVGLESDFPYTPGNQACKPGITPHFKISSFSTATSMQARKLAISGKGPVIAAMKVFRDFPYYKGGIYTPVTSDLVGLHAICAIGYDNTDKCWIIKNSWGSGWGSGGYGRIAFGTTCEIDGSFPFWIPEM